MWVVEEFIFREGCLGMFGRWKGKDQRYLLLNVYGPQLTSQK